MYECHKGSQCVHSFPQVVQFQVTESVNLREIQKSSCLLEIYHTCLSAKVFHESRCELWYLNMWMPLSETWGLTWGMQGGGEGLCCSGNKSYDKGGCIWFSPLLPHQAPWASCLYLPLTLGEDSGPVSLYPPGNILNLAGCKREPWAQHWREKKVVWSK